MNLNSVIAFFRLTKGKVIIVLILLAYYLIFNYVALDAETMAFSTGKSAYGSEFMSILLTCLADKSSNETCTFSKDLMNQSFNKVDQVSEKAYNQSRFINAFIEDKILLPVALSIGDISSLLFRPYLSLLLIAYWYLLACIISFVAKRLVPSK